MTRLLLVTAALLLPAATAEAATYRVGPGEAFATIQATLPRLRPGDVVEVVGGQTYPGDLWFETEHSGRPGMPVTVRGIAVGGRRPVLSGVGTEQWHTMIVLLHASHFVFEGFEIVGDGNPDHAGIIHKANDVVIRDVVVHGVGSHGLLGTDEESGSLILERSEFYGNGNGLYDHQIYMATDESMFPGSVFRMQYCYVHDGAGGNNVKSRAERNEIYYNWIEGAVFHELDLIGPDGQNPGLAREDSDVVGNVLIKHSEWRIARIGGDGTGNTAGRYRFVNNTIVLGAESGTAIGMQETVQTLELHNNVFLRVGAPGGRLVRHTDPSGPAPTVGGSHNFIQSGFTDIPPSLTATVSGTSPGLTDLASLDLRPSAGSALVDAGSMATATLMPSFPRPLELPVFTPPSRALGAPTARAIAGAMDIGAFELGSGSPPGPGGALDGGLPPSGRADSGPSGGVSADASSGGARPDAGVSPPVAMAGCAASRAARGPGPGCVFLVICAALLARARRRGVAVSCACAFAFLGSVQPALAQLPAFPGAEGFGAVATGGRGPGARVIRVTTLAGTGPGSLQAALDATGPRFVVFAVSGVIARDITVTNGDVTIAGQTAPGAGITIQGRFFGEYSTQVGNIIVRHLRVRPPPRGSVPGNQYDAVQFSRNRRVIFDHVSASWGVDETFDIYEARDVTVQWSDIVEADQNAGHPDGPNHNYGMINGPDGGRVSIHHCLFAHNLNRNPAMATGPIEVRNNVVYNVRHGFIHQNPASGSFNVVGNCYKQGPNNTLIPFFFDDEDASPTAYYLADNAIDDPGDYVGVVDNPWQTPFRHPSFANLSKPVSARSATEFDFSGAGHVRVTTQPSSTGCPLVLSQVGAYPRDVVTLRALTETQGRTGTFGARRPADLLAGLSVTTAPTDSDADGMPDAWETSRGLNPAQASDAVSVRPSGYFAIEEYINERADALVNTTPTPMLDGGVPSDAGLGDAGPSGAQDAGSQLDTGVRDVADAAGPASDAGGAPDASLGDGAARDAASSVRDATAGPDGAATIDGGDAARGPGGCGCRATGADRGPWAGGLGLLVAVATLATRRAHRGAAAR